MQRMHLICDNTLQNSDIVFLKHYAKLNNKDESWPSLHK